MGILLTGRRISAAQALEHGLVNEVVPDEALDAAVDAWVRDVVACAPLSLKAIKRSVRDTAQPHGPGSPQHPPAEPDRGASEPGTRRKASSPSGRSARRCGPAAEGRERQGPPHGGRVGVERRLRPDARGGAAVLRGGGGGRVDPPRLGTAAHLSLRRRPADPEAGGLLRHPAVRAAPERHAADRRGAARAASFAGHPARLRPAARGHRQPARRRQRAGDHHHPRQPDRALPARGDGPVRRRPSGRPDPGRGPGPRRDHALRRPGPRGPRSHLLAGPAPRRQPARRRCESDVRHHGPRPCACGALVPHPGRMRRLPPALPGPFPARCSPSSEPRWTPSRARTSRWWSRTPWRS